MTRTVTALITGALLFTCLPAEDAHAFRWWPRRNKVTKPVDTKRHNKGGKHHSFHHSEKAPLAEHATGEEGHHVDRADHAAGEHQHAGDAKQPSAHTEQPRPFISDRPIVAGFEKLLRKATGRPTVFAPTREAKRQIRKQRKADGLDQLTWKENLFALTLGGYGGLFTMGAFGVSGAAAELAFLSAFATGGLSLVPLAIPTVAAVLVGALGLKVGASTAHGVRDWYGVNQELADNRKFVPRATAKLAAAKRDWLWGARLALRKHLNKLPKHWAKGLARKTKKNVNQLTEASEGFEPALDSMDELNNTAMMQRDQRP